MVISTPPNLSRSPAPPPGDRHSLDDYWQLEQTAEHCHEYLDGVIVPLAGGSAIHSSIAVNLVAFLHFALRDTPFQVYNSDLRVWIPQYRCCTYTDGMIVEGDPQFHDDRDDEILNPSLIVEVLSPSTERYDRGEKFRKYRSLARVKEYLLVSQDEPYIEHYFKVNATTWNLTSYAGIDQSLQIECANLALPLAEVYCRIAF